MPVSLSGVGSVLGGIGSVLGSTQSFGSEWPSSNKRLEAYGREDTVIRRRVQDARNAGIHPLYALGMSPSAPSFGGTVSKGRDVGRGLRGVGRAVSGFGERKVARQLAEAELAVKYSQASMYDARANRDIVESQLEASNEAKSSAGASPGRVPLYVKAWDNRKDLGALAPGEMFIVNADNPAEGLEGIGAVTLSAGGTMTGERKRGLGPIDRRLLKAYKWLRKKPKYRSGPRTQRYKRRHLPDRVLSN